MMDSEEKALSIQGVSINLPLALFTNSKDARCLVGTDLSISNGHWCIFAGSPDLAIIRKAGDKRAKGGEIDWKKPNNYTLSEVKRPWDSTTHFRQELSKLWKGKRYALANPHLVMNRSGSSLALHAYLPMKPMFGGTHFKAARKEMDVPYEVWFDPKYMLAFIKLGFEVLIGPGEKVKKKSNVWDKELGVQKEVEEWVHKPQVALLGRFAPNDQFEVRGCIMPMTNGEYR